MVNSALKPRRCIK